MVAMQKAQIGFQAALMAPTEILAEQHFRTLSRFAEPLGLRVVLLTGGLGAAERRALAQEKHRLHCFNCGGVAQPLDDACSWCGTALV